jgi:hypothetical protein
MPTKRKPRSRDWHPGRFNPQAIALFLELEHMPQSKQKFRDKSHELARLLGLVSEWWTCQHVNDRSERPCHPPGYIAHKDWHKCRQVRRALLAAVASWPTAEATPGRHLNQ